MHIIHIVYLKMCQELSELSKCSKHKVGALLVKNNRIISNGLNGSHKNMVNCCDKFHGIDTHSEPGKTQHRKWAEINENHAEHNVIAFAAKNGINIDNTTLYCNLEPCFNCLNLAVSSGVKEIYYSTIHKQNLNSSEALEMIRKLGIKIEHIPIQ